MDRIITNTGGQPFLRRDIDFLQNNIEQLGSDIAGLVCDGATVLSGCVITRSGTNISYTEGSICIEGKVYHVKAGTLTSSASTLYWVVKYRDSDRRKFKNKSEHEVYRKFICTLQENKSGAYKSVSTDDAVKNFGKALVNRLSSQTFAEELSATFNDEEGWSGKAYRVPGISCNTIVITAQLTSAGGGEAKSGSQVVTLPVDTLSGRVSCMATIMSADAPVAGCMFYNKDSAKDEIFVQAVSASGQLSSGSVTIILTDYKLPNP